MLRIVCSLAAAIMLFAGVTSAGAAIVINVDKSAQKLSVVVDGTTKYEWPVSTARRGYKTPNGSYKPQWLARKWFSRQYHYSPMPHSIFFNEGYAIHGSYEVSRLGHPASHGCIRLNPKNAALLFALVKGHTDDTTIVVTGDKPEKTMQASNSHKKKKHHAKSKPKSKQITASATGPTGPPANGNGFFFSFTPPPAR